MVNKKRNTTKAKLITTCLVLMMTVTFLSGCGSKNAEGTVTIGADLTATNGCLHPQVSTMLNAQTKDTLNIEGDSYTFTKEFSTNPAGEDSGKAGDSTAAKESATSEKSAASESGDKSFTVTYTFTGKVSSSDGDKYVLTAPTNCEYNISWGVINTLGEGFAPTVDGEGTEKDDPSSLNWFYGPYVADSKDNTKSMTVYIKDGELSFEDFTITE